MIDYKKILKVTNIPDSEVRIVGEIAWTDIKPFFNKTKNEIISKFELPGFRAGKVPEHLIKEHLNDILVLNEAFEAFIKEEYEVIVKELALFPVDHPKISIKKLAVENPIEFEIDVAVIPKIALPDYKKILKTLSLEGESTDATKEEMHNTIVELGRAVAQSKKEVFDDKNFNPDTIDTAFIAQFGDYSSVEDFKEKLSASIKKDKERKQKDKNRITMLEALVKEFKVEIPKIFIESELDRMLRELYNDIARLNVGPKEYFERIKKTEQEVRDEWRTQAIERVKIEMILSEIAKLESMTPEQHAIDHEVTHILDKDKSLDKNRLEEYVRHMMTNDKTLDYLESLVK